MSIYSDLPYDLDINEFGDLELVEDVDSIKQSLQTICLTKVGAKTKYQNPLFGSAVADLLFEKMNPFTLSSLEDEIESAIENWEPRVEVSSVDLETDVLNHQIKIIIIYKVINLNITDELIISLATL